ncbi:MAG: hypothetical protein Q8P27_02750, partial [Candidatus Peregrinibacteria bacterium]|nr:hypothetical protein [Candidatus Peregrinibacteria bacterium]
FAEPYWALEAYSTGPVIAWTALPSWEGDFNKPEFLTNIEPTEPERFFMIVQQGENNRRINGWSIGERRLNY